MSIVTYHYRDEYGNVLYSKIRVQSAIDSNQKQFYYEREIDGKKVQGLGSSRRVLYRLPELLLSIAAGNTIFLVEGEKDVETLRAQGLAATTSMTSWLEEYTQVLHNANVVILYDNDKAGIKRRDLLCKALHERVKSLRVVDLPGLEYREKHGLDITDWLERGNTVDQLQILVNETPCYSPPEVPKSNTDTASPVLFALTCDELLAWDLPPREMLLLPFFPSQGLVMLVAKRGVGKTHIALGIACAVATGGTFLKWTAPTPKKVLYIDGEMPGVVMIERMRMIIEMVGKNPGAYLKTITPDRQDFVLPDLASAEGRKAFEPLIRDAELVIIDNISCLFRSGGENESESWQEVQEWALDLRRRGKSVLFVHHAGKSGAQRGTSKREDILDTVVMLRHAEGYKSHEGASFDVIFDKARHFTGNDARGFHACLCKEDDKSRWQLSELSDDDEIKNVVTKKQSGATIAKIAEETGLTKSQVETRIKKGKESGLL